MSKRKKKTAQNFFILKYVIKSFKTIRFYYLKILMYLNFLWRYESSTFLIFTSKTRIKSETLAMRNVISTAKNSIFLGTCFWVRFGHLRYISV